MRKMMYALVTTASLTVACLVIAQFSNLIPDKTLAADVLSLAQGGGFLCGMASVVIAIILFAMFAS